VINLVSPSKAKICIGGVRERNVDDELCGRSDKEMETTEQYVATETTEQYVATETTEQYVATEIMKNQVHWHFYSNVTNNVK